jgi:enoyl-CoA hydratase/long-chain 3-hydroxyacyl-CoA dehydrogenase
LALTSRPLLDALVIRKAKEGVMKATQGNYPAPLKILDVVRAGLIDGEKEGYEMETQVFNDEKIPKSSDGLRK